MRGAEEGIHQEDHLSPRVVRLVTTAGFPEGMPPKAVGRPEWGRSVLNWKEPVFHFELSSLGFIGLFTCCYSVEMRED